MKKLNFSLLSLLAILSLAIMLSSCAQEELRSSDAELSTDLQSESFLPLLEPVTELDNNTDEAIAENQIYADFGSTVDKNNRDCAYDVYLAYHRYYVAYYYWFYNPTYSNCVSMSVAYCDYLLAHRACYGGPLVECHDFDC